MKTICIILIGIIAAASAVSLFNFSEWEQFKLNHGKTYQSEDEENLRREIFLENKATIEKHNKKYEQGLVSYKMGINQFSDLLHHEFLATHSTLKFTNNKKTTGEQFVSRERTNLPKSVDWRNKGAVTPVKDQKQCGSCWSFSTTGSVEGQHFLKTGKLVALSEQNLVDCSTGNNGCYGGFMDNAFKYIINNGGIDTEKSYPYVARNSDCKYNPSNSAATIRSYVDVPSGDEEKLKEAVATIGPISVAIDASAPSFRHYIEGVYHEEECSSHQLDHGVLLVGYGTESGKDYWIVKNSWNAGWGDHGYIKMARNRNNHCGIATMASYPIV